MLNSRNTLFFFTAFLGAGVFALSGCEKIEVSHSPLCQNHNVTLVMGNTGKIIEAETACTMAQREKGLMSRPVIEENKGMIFLFPRPAIQAFWMKNTEVPLSIAYIDENWKIIDIHEMKAEDETPVYSKSPAMYAIEANKDWFQSIPLGTKVYLKK